MIRRTDKEEKTGDQTNRLGRERARERQLPALGDQREIDRKKRERGIEKENLQQRVGVREIERDRERDRHTHREKEREMETMRQGEKERERGEREKTNGQIVHHKGHH